MVDIFDGFDTISPTECCEERVGHGKHEEFHRMMDRLKAIHRD